MPSSKLKSRSRAVACCAVLAGAFGASAASATTFVDFHAGTYDLSSISEFGTPTDLLTITISGGIATFTVSGGDTATWQIPNDIAPDDGFLGVGNPIFTTSVSAASWSTATFPYVVFFTTADEGGLAIGDIPGSGIFINLFTSSDGPGQVFSLVPEPTEWALLLAGFAGLGAALRARRRGANTVMAVN